MSYFADSHARTHIPWDFFPRWHIPSPGLPIVRCACVHGRATSSLQPGPSHSRPSPHILCVVKLQDPPGRRKLSIRPGFPRNRMDLPKPAPWWALGSHVSELSPWFPQNPCHTSPSVRSHFPQVPGHQPEGRLMRFPSLSFSRFFLNLPLRFLTRGFSWHSWWMMMWSSRCRMSISRSASSRSRRRSSSSWFFCWSAARVSSSSQVCSSCQAGRTTAGVCVASGPCREGSPLGGQCSQQPGQLSSDTPRFSPQRRWGLNSWLENEHLTTANGGKAGSEEPSWGYI